MTAWWVDRVLPSLVSALLWAPAALWLQHRAIGRRVTEITRRQTEQLKEPR